MTNQIRSFSKDCLSDALLMLMNTKPISEITVADITQKAGVSRATWFRSFDDKREAVIYNLVRKWERWADDHNLSNANQIRAENVNSFVDYIYEIREIRHALELSDMISAILDSFLAVLVGEQARHPTSDYFTRQFLTYGITGIVNAWAESDYSVDKEEIASYLYKFISQHID